MTWQRPDGRLPDQMRPISFSHCFTRLAPGSVLTCFGETRVLCTVSVQETVPKFLANSGRGWLTAEYRMLPSATAPRQERELMKLSGRTQEIQRLIGRSLRSTLNFERLGERTLMVDADVLQADGGTRTAAITGCYVALKDAIDTLMASQLLTEDPLENAVAAVSVGLVGGVACLDLNYIEDSQASVDCNVVMNRQFDLIEVQGTAETGSYNRQQLNQFIDLAQLGIQELFHLQAQPKQSEP